MITYKQALRGLFTPGTSPFPLSAGETTEKVGSQQGLNTGNSSPVCPQQPLRGTNRKQMKGIIGKKIGMTSVFAADGKQTAYTIIEAGPCVVTQVKTNDTDG